MVSVEALYAAICRRLVGSHQLVCAHVVEELSDDSSHEILASVTQYFCRYRMQCNVVLQTFEDSVGIGLGDGICTWPMGERVVYRQNVRVATR